MPLKSILIPSVTGWAELFQHLRDWLCSRNGTLANYSTTGAGWTLHDSFYAVDENTPTSGDWFVICSPGENGKQDLYFLIGSDSSQYLQVRICLSWDNVTHVGQHVMTAVSNINGTTSSVYPTYLFATLDYFYVRCNLSNGLFFAGLITIPFLDTTIATSVAPVAAGADVSVTLDNVPGTWRVGSLVIVRDLNNIEQISISELSGKSVTFANIVNSYSAGCRFAEEYPLICTRSIVFPSTLTVSALISSQTGALLPTNGFCGSGQLGAAYVSLDPLTGVGYAAPVIFRGVGVGLVGELPGFLQISPYNGHTVGDTVPGENGEIYRLLLCGGTGTSNTFLIRES